MILLRYLLGDVLRRHRQLQGRTLREVSAAARISLGYLSEVERGQKEASSELLSSICEALDIPLSDVLNDVSEQVAAFEPAQAAPVPAETAGDGATLPRTIPASPQPAAPNGPGTREPVGAVPVGATMNSFGAPMTYPYDVLNPQATQRGLFGEDLTPLRV